MEKKKWQAPTKGSAEEKKILDLLKTFSSTLRKIPLYPPTHPMVKDSILKLYFIQSDHKKQHQSQINIIQIPHARSNKRLSQAVIQEDSDQRGREKLNTNI